MFKWLFTYWSNPTDTPSILFKINLWTHSNIRIFRIKMARLIAFFITTIDALTLKHVKIFYKDWSFESFYFRSIFWLIMFIIFVIVTL
jgi:hypothetical protein